MSSYDRLKLCMCANLTRNPLSAVLCMPSRRLIVVLVSLVVGLLLLIGVVVWWRFGFVNLRSYNEQAVFFTGEALRLPAELAGLGNIRVVHFWDPECPCHEETDAHLNYLIGMYRFAELDFYSVQKPGSVGHLAPFLADKLKPLANLQGIESIPASPAIAIWDKSGQLAYAGPYSEGLVCNSSNSFVEPILDALVRGRAVNSTGVVAQGCYCNWQGAKN